MMADWTDIAAAPVAERDPRFDRPPIAPNRERRVHARAYRYWQQLRGGARMPDIALLDPARLTGFAGNSVLFELAGADHAPAIRFIGAALAQEAAADPEAPQSIVPAANTVLGELASRLPLIATTGAPLDFEAEFVGQDARTCYRGVLLPFADASGRTAFIYGVISWKIADSAAPGEDLRAAIGSAFALAPLVAPVAPTSPWDLPSVVESRPILPPQSFAQRLAAAQTWAALAAADHAHRAASLHAALSAAYDFLIAQENAIGTGPDGAEIAAVLDLVFGPGLDDVARGRHRAVLGHAIALRIGAGGLAAFLDRHADGIAGFLGAQPPAPAAWPDLPYLTLSAIDEAASETTDRPVQRGATPDDPIALNA